MKVLVDMNLPPAWVGFFAASGIEAEHWSSHGSANASDRAILEWAGTRRYLVFTHDLDFGALLQQTLARGPSVIQVRCVDVTPDAIGALVLNALQQYGEAIARGVLITIEPSRARVRLLPLS